MEFYFIEFSYLLASILFILGLKGLSHPESAKRGMHLAEFGMLMAIIGTLMHHEIVTYTWILVYSRNVISFLALLIKDGQLQLDMNDDVVGPSCVTYNGEVVNQRVAAALQAQPG